MVTCLEQGADLHMAQLMPLSLTVSCFSKIQIGFTFWYRPTRVVPEKGPLNGCVCVSLSSNILLTCLHYKNSLCVSVCCVLIVQIVEAARCKVHRVLREICTFGMNA